MFDFKNIYDFVEIGTCDFDTQVHKACGNIRGISVEPLKYYFDRLPVKKGCVKENLAVSNTRGTMNISYVSKTDIMSHNLPLWVSGCNCIGKSHPTVEKLLDERGLKHLIKTTPVKVITYEDLMKMYNVDGVNFLKIDTEGHDPVILESMMEYCDKYPECYPVQIKFETNGLNDKQKEKSVLDELNKKGYVIVSQGADTVLKLDRLLPR